MFLANAMIGMAAVRQPLTRAAAVASPIPADRTLRHLPLGERLVSMVGNVFVSRPFYCPAEPQEARTTNSVGKSTR